MPFENEKEQVEASRRGGLAVVKKYGVEYMRQLGKKGKEAQMLAFKRKNLFTHKEQEQNPFPAGENSFNASRSID